MLVAALVGIAVTVVVARSGGDGSHPGEWDPHVVDLVAFVEEERELSFEHPVPIDFLTAEQYADRVRVDGGEMATTDQELLDESVATLAALGLVAHDLDLAETSGELADSGTLALYDPVAERIVVRGTEMTVGLRVTLVHELVHVAQDQAFDLERPRGDGSSSAFEAFRMLVEGDADRIMHRYVERLDAEELAAYEAEMAAVGAATAGEMPPGLEEVPGGMVALFSAPYAFGDPLAEMIAADGGNAAIDAAFDDPPSTSEHGFDARSYLARDEPVEVPEPEVPDDARAIGDPTAGLGATMLFVVLAERVDVPTALAAADGWGGDAAVAYRDGSTTCVRAHLTGDDPTDTDEISAALEAWVEAGPDGAASVDDVRAGSSGRYVQFDTCLDPGDDELPSPSGNSLTALVYPAIRAQAAALAVRDGVDPWTAFEVGTCVADAAPADLSSPGIDEQMRAIIERCRQG